MLVFPSPSRHLPFPLAAHRACAARPVSVCEARLAGVDAWQTLSRSHLRIGAPLLELTRLPSPPLRRSASQLSVLATPILCTDDNAVDCKHNTAALSQPLCSGTACGALMLRPSISHSLVRRNRHPTSCGSTRRSSHPHPRLPAPRSRLRGVVQHNQESQSVDSQPTHSFPTITHAQKSHW